MRGALLARRLAVNHLDRRLPAGAHARAARSGLQDSGPRGAILSLHARVDDVRAGAWRGPEMAQVWGPRGAVWLVARRDVPVFTLGLLPRDPAARRRIQADALLVHEALAGRVGTLAEAEAPLPGDRGGRRLRWAGTTGTLLPRWDTRTTQVTPVNPPAADPEECRIELARRFFHYLGPATVPALQRWTGTSRSDAETTLARLADELVAIETPEGAGWLPAGDAAGWAATRPVPSVRMLPGDDPYLQRPGRTLIVPDPALRARLWPEAPPPGAVVAGGEVLGTWRRRGRRVTVQPWLEPPPAAVVAVVEDEVARFPLAGDPEPVEWLPPWRP